MDEPKLPVERGMGPREQGWIDLAHDLRNPLAVVVGRVQLMRRRLRRGKVEVARIESDLESIESSLARLKALIDRIDNIG
jgi:signal transduction histidine kinase